MWVYIPGQLSAFSQESAGLISPSDECFQRLSASSTWRGKSRRWRLWQRAWSRATWMQRRFGPTFARSQSELSEIVSTWWLEGFPARTSATPAGETASTASDPDSSTPSWTSFATYDRATSSWRTLQRSLFEDEGWMPFSGRWPKAGSLRSTAVCERRTLARHIREIAGGALPGIRSRSAWPTITMGDAESGQTRPNKNRQGGAEHESLRVATAQWQTPYGFNGQDKDGGYGTGGEFEKSVKLWATASAGAFNDAESPEQWRSRQTELKAKGINGNGAGVPLAIQAKETAENWGTPSASPWRSGDASDATMERNARPLNEQTVHWNGPDSRPAQEIETDGPPSSNAIPTSRLQLNERFVEALMGLPPGWTDFEDSATPSCHSKQRPLSASSGTAPSESGHD